MTRKQTGGSWDPKGGPVYFLAGSEGSVGEVAHDYPFILVAVNELGGKKAPDRVEGWLDAGARVLLDSGVFWLSNEHARRHGLTMDEALSAAPEQVDGFDALFKRYCSLIDRFGDRLWGYIEIDQGGKANKVRTRGRLESLGYRPIPVYHPLVDGPEYFDELASEYDRLCFGNVVQADSKTRRRLLTSMWERRRQYPDLWIHVLGYTPDEFTTAWPPDSADSSTWLGAMRWPIGGTVKAAGKSYGQMTPALRYRLGSARDADDGVARCSKLQAREALSEMRSWQDHQRRQRDVLSADPRGTVTP